MSLWPPDYNRPYEYPCPADVTCALEAAELFAASTKPLPRVCAGDSGCNTCSSTKYQRVGIVTGSTANTMSALNITRMINTILRAKAGAAFGSPCTRGVGSSVANHVRARNKPVEFVPSLVMRRIESQ